VNDICSTRLSRNPYLKWWWRPTPPASTMRRNADDRVRLEVLTVEVHKRQKATANAPKGGVAIGLSVKRLVSNCKVDIVQMI